MYDHTDASGFINLFGLSLKVRALKMQEVDEKAKKSAKTSVKKK
jgi:argininosuccinate synthase